MTLATRSGVEGPDSPAAAAAAAAVAACGVWWPVRSSATAELPTPLQAVHASGMAPGTAGGGRRSLPVLSTCNMVLPESCCRVPELCTNAPCY